MTHDRPERHRDCRRPATASDHGQIADPYLDSRADALPHLHRIRDDEQDRVWVKTVVLQRGQSGSRPRVVRWWDFLTLVGDDLDKLYLLPGWYRQGIGSKVLAKAKAASPELLRLYTFQVNVRARAFYEDHGFVAVRFGDGSLNEAREPDVQ